MKELLLVFLLALTVLFLTIVGQANGQVPPSAGTEQPGNAGGQFPSMGSTPFPAPTGNTDLSAAGNPQNTDMVMPESGLGTGTNTTTGGSGTGSGGLGLSTYGPYTSSPVGTNK